ncbi:hypothetical protein GCM10012275_62520 [Longimycelium tulufanense]|uniref:Type II toxin-antitoxin system RelE/ParE family toxin n=1 Tax=Longimycelium tulufanense TaxID=907463 RepID=A0A8J3FXX7_9PSEU|nr:type II toxin-antitoxin system RelE/ParE family toxin [Longimycelium tulufanense]GGM83387.1 hypothetical protein GCM10012275_62520 [Longimycelium tulufanense]
MDWGTVELEPEVDDWLLNLDDDDFHRVMFYIDLLAERGPLLDEPYTRQLQGKLRELRLYLGRARQRITYWIAPGRRIVLLTVFRKTKQRETAEVERAHRAMERCQREQHTADEEDTR